MLTVRSVFISTVPFVVLSLLLMPTFQVGTYQDDALYINLAHAMADGNGYVDLMQVGDPSHSFVPPVYPAILSPLIGIFAYEWLLANNFWPLQLLSLGLTLGGLICFAFILKQLQVASAVPILVVAALAPITVGMAWQVMSEASYFLLSMAALAALTMWTKRPSNLTLLGLSLICAGLACTTRLIGISLVLAIMFFLCRRLRPLPWLLSSMILVTPVSSWFLRNSMLGTSAAGEYSAALAPSSVDSLVRTVYLNFTSMASALIPGVILPGLNGPQAEALVSRLGLGFLPAITGVVILIILLVGVIHSLKAPESVWVIELYVAFYVGILLVSQFALDGGERYLAPIFPFLVLYFWQGSTWLLQRMPGFRSPVRVARTMAVVAALFLTLYLARGVQAVMQPVRDRLPDVTLGTTWLRANTPANAIVMANGPREVYLYAQRKVIPFPLATADRRALAQHIACSQAAYVLVRARMKPGAPHWDEMTAQFIVPTLTEYSSIFKRIFSSPNDIARVYRIDRSNGIVCE